jgi:hypothetical protein
MKVGWRKLYRSPIICITVISITRVGFLKKIRRAEHVAWMAAIKFSDAISGRIPGIYRRNCEYNIKIFLKIIGLDSYETG